MLLIRRHKIKVFKRAAAALIVLALISSCGKTNANEGQNKDFTKDELVSLISTAYEGLENMPMLETRELSLTDDAPYINTSIGIKDLQTIDLAVVSEGMTTTPYMLAIAKVKEGSDIEKLKKEALDTIALNKWICVSADVAYVNNYGRAIIVLMAKKDIADSVYASLEKASQNGLGKKLEKTE